MTTLTQDQAVEAVNEAQAAVQVAEEKLEVVEEALAGRTYSGQYAKLDLDAITQNIAANIVDRAKVSETGIKLDRKSYYEIAEEQGIAKRTLESVEQFNEQFALGFHAVAADKALSTFKDNADAGEFTARADIGKNTTYKDTFRRFDSRTVPTGAGGERRIQETHGYHNPSIKTDYKGFESNRQAVHALAKDLLG